MIIREEKGRQQELQNNVRLLGVELLLGFSTLPFCSFLNTMSIRYLVCTASLTIMPFSGGILFGYGKDTACFFSTSCFKNKFILIFSRSFSL
jgi:hypothetical protein